MALSLPTPPSNAQWLHPEDSTPGTNAQMPQFNTLLLHIIRGRFYGPTKRSFRFHARLGVHEERSGLILSKPPGKEFEISNILRFPYTPQNQKLAITARLEARSDKYLGHVFLDLSGVSPERNSLTAQIPLRERDGTVLGLFDVEVELIYDDEAADGGEDGAFSPRSPLNFTHPMTPAGLARRFGISLSTAQSTTMSPKAGDRAAIEVPFRGLNVTITIGSRWKSVAGKKVQGTVTVGSTPMRSKELVQVTPEGDFKMDLLFRHRFDGERLILLSIGSESGEPVGDAVVDAVMMIEMGIVTCVQNLQFYTRLGKTAGCARVVFDFSYSDPGTPRIFAAALPGATAKAEGKEVVAPVAYTKGLVPTKDLALPEKGIVAEPAVEPLHYEGDETTAPGVTQRDWSSPAALEGSQGGDEAAWNDTIDAPTSIGGTVSRSVSKKSHHKERSARPARQDGVPGAATAKEDEVVSRKPKMQGLLCSVTRIFDYVPGTMNCDLSTVIGSHEAICEPINCTFQDTAVRRIFVLPYAGEDELIIRSLLRKDFDTFAEGRMSIPSNRSEEGLREVQLVDSEGTYQGRVELWVQLTPGVIGTAPGSIPFAESPEYRDLMLPPIHMAALALAENEGPSRKRNTGQRSGRLVLPRQQHAPASPRCLGSPTGLRPKDSHYIALLDQAQNPDDEWEPERNNASSILFKIHGFRNLPDPYRCESMKVVIVARMGSVSAVSAPLRFSHLDPDLDNCVFRLPRNGHRYIQIDLLEVTLVKSPLKLGHFVWDANCADQLSGVDHGYTRMQGGPTYCLHTAMLCAEDFPDPVFFGTEDAVPLEMPQLDVISSQGSSSIPMELGDGGASPSAIASLVLVARIVHNLRTPFPFTHVEICMEVEFGGFSQRSASVLSNKFYRVPLNARFRLPLTSTHHVPPLNLKLFAATPVSEPQLIAHGTCDLNARPLQDGGYSATIQMVYAEPASGDQPPLLEMSVKRSKRVVRAPEVERLGSRAVVSGVPISAF